MTSLPSHASDRKLGLVIDLDICVGCHACAVNCKEWNSGGHMAPLTDYEAWGDSPSGVWFNRVHSFEAGEGASGRGSGRGGGTLPSASGSKRGRAISSLTLSNRTRTDIPIRTASGSQPTRLVVSRSPACSTNSTSPITYGTSIVGIQRW